MKGEIIWLLVVKKYCLTLNVIHTYQISQLPTYCALHLSHTRVPGTGKGGNPFHS